MITLTRLSGSVFALNPDLIERIDATPDTVLTLVDGKKYLVLEGLPQVVAAVLRHRSEIIALSCTLQEGDLAPSPHTPARLGTVSEHPARRSQLIPGSES